MKAEKLIQLLNENYNPKRPKLRKIKMDKTYQVVDHDSKEAEDGEASESGFDYEDKIFDDIYDIAIEIEGEGAGDVGSDYFSTENDMSTDGTTTDYSFHPELKKDELEYLKHLLKLKSDHFRLVRDEHREEQEFKKSIPKTTKPKVDIE